MNSENGKTSDLDKLFLNLSEKIDLKRDNKDVSLSNISVCCTWTNHTKSQIKTIKLKYQLQHGMTILNYLMDDIVFHTLRSRINGEGGGGCSNKQGRGKFL